MGVDFYACKACGRTFPDCGEYVTCSDDDNGCGARYCSAKCAQIQQPENEPDDVDWEAYEAMSEEEQKTYRTTCVDCRGDLESDENLLNFALAELGVTFEDLTTRYRARTK